MEDSPVKDLNEMEASELSHIKFKSMLVRMLKELTDKLQGDQWVLTQHKKVNRNYKQEPGRKNTIPKK